jgi:hypothetical protein
VAEEKRSSNGKSTPTPSGNGSTDGFDFGVGGAKSSAGPAKPKAAESEQRRSRKSAAAAYEPTYEDPPRQPKSERPDAFNPTLWLIEGVGGFLDEIQHNDLGLPEEFWVHAYAARKEGLLAARALIDHAIQRSDEELAKAAQQEEKKARRGGVNIEFGS